MTPEQLLQVCRQYRETFEPLCQAPKRFVEHDRQPTQQERYDHIAWMLDQMPSIVEAGKIEKAMRWLGFVQGAMWSMNISSIAAFKDDNRSKP